MGLLARLALFPAGVADNGVDVAAFAARFHFFSSVVRIQLDRGQTVCTDGPYRYVRHPGYVGGILFGLATPLILGSLWALIPQGLAALLLVWRTAREDRTLQAELPGYEQFMQQTRYRLLPNIW
jgi:protein-S-isoprenylcysteine O-methyltransferase Ste14